jgi:hypothetical protein
VAAEERGEPLPLHGAASGTVWQTRLMPPLFTNLLEEEFCELRL